MRKTILAMLCGALCAGGLFASTAAVASTRTPAAATSAPDSAAWRLDPGTAVEMTAREAARLIAADAHEERIVVLGEMHGTHEAPALAAELVRLRAVRDDGGTGTGVTLALEVHATEQARIDAFVASSGDAASREALLSGPFWNVPRERSDGRRSVAMLALLEAARELRADGVDLRVLAFDVGNSGAGSGDRKPRIAAALRHDLERNERRQFVLLIGKYHARRVAPRRVGGLMPGHSPPIPTMAYLADVPMLIIDVTAERGEFWGCMGDACQAWSLNGGRAAPMEGEVGALDAALGPTVPMFHRTPNDTAGYDAQLVLPRLSVAEPVVVERAAGS